MQQDDDSLTNRSLPPMASKDSRLQPPTRTRIRQQKLKYTFIGYIIVLIFLAITQFIGVGFFKEGFYFHVPYYQIFPIVHNKLIV